MKQIPPAIAVDGQQVFVLHGLAKPALITLNGIVLQPADFVMNGESVTLAARLTARDEVGGIRFKYRRRATRVLPTIFFKDLLQT